MLGDTGEDHYNLHRENNIKLLTTGEFSDFSIHCGNHRFRLHRAIITGHSKFFDALIRGSFQESMEQCVTLQEDDAETVALLVLFMYSGLYPGINIWSSVYSDWLIAPCVDIQKECFLKLMSDVPNTIPSGMSLDIRMVEAGDRYMLKSLSDAATMSFQHKIYTRSCSELIGDPEFTLAVELLSQASYPCDYIWGDIAYSFVQELLEGTKQDTKSGHKKSGNSESAMTHFLPTFGEKFSNFSFMLFKELSYMSQPPKWTCSKCQSTHRKYAQQNFLVLRPSVEGVAETIEWQECCCYLRGYCSWKCQPAEANLKATFTYCHDCVVYATDYKWICAIQRDISRKLEQIPSGSFECSHEAADEEFIISRV